MNGHAKMETKIGTVENTQTLLRNKEADLWAGKSARGRAEEWVDTARIGYWYLWVLGMEAVTTAGVGEALSSWPSRNTTYGSHSAKSVAQYQCHTGGWRGSGVRRCGGKGFSSSEG